MNNDSDAKNSRLEVFNLIKSSNGSQMLEGVFERSFANQIVHVEFIEKLFVIGICLSGGAILLLKLNVRENVDNYQLAEKISDVTNNYEAIGLALDYGRGYLFVYSQSTSVSMYEINYNSKIKDVKLFKNKVVAMKHNYESKNSVVVDETGAIWVVTYDNNDMQLYKSVTLTTMGELSLFELDWKHDLGIVAFNDGSYALLEVKFGVYHLVVTLLKEHSTKDGRFVGL